MRSAILRLPPFCLTRANHSGSRASTVAVAVASPRQAGSSPTALMSSSATARASGSAAKKRFAPGRGSAKFFQPSVLNARTYTADGAAGRLRRAHPVYRVDHYLARERRAVLVHNARHGLAGYGQHDHVGVFQRVADAPNRCPARALARTAPGSVHHFVPASNSCDAGLIPVATGTDLPGHRRAPTGCRP